MMKSLLSAIAYLEENLVVHRDLKPENIMIVGGGESITIRIIDFGLAKRLSDPNEKLLDRCGSPGYVAPEILKDEGYNCRADVFSAGSILYTMLTGRALFKGISTNKVLQQNMKCDLDFDHFFINSISAPAKDLVCKMIRKHPNERISPKEALEHPWITGAPFVQDDS